ncbi:hypothetical protein EB796_003746 [Bugula neritina]|uniref:Uncharacterized protein n=1 Tax=Bugula neritina TaxID=10212 RepID=A0A7J7KJ85_BUGNE|nr:hypothetical protein EB796_003746 [Bugula neritina]
MIAREARDLSNDPAYDSPFAKAAASNGYHMQGQWSAIVINSLFTLSLTIQPKSWANGSQGIWNLVISSHNLTAYHSIIIFSLAWK